MKLYQILLKKIGLWKEPPVVAEETKVYNPINGARVGGSVTIDRMDCRGLNFFVKEIKEYNVHLNGKKFTDYVLLARPLGLPDMWVRLRLVPDESGLNKMTHTVLLLSQYDSLAYNEGLHGVVQDKSKKFVVDDTKNDDNPANDTHDEYFRVGDVGSSYTATVKTLKDENSDGKVEESEVKHSQLEFWDYHRMAKIDGVDEEQFLFVEMNKDDGWFTLWQGVEISPERVDAI